MIGYHGSDTQIATIHGGIGNGIYLATTADVAAAYGPIVHTIDLADANIAGKWDIEDAVEAVRYDETTGFDPADYSPWALLEMNEVRQHLIDAGFDGVELDDVTPQGDDHDAVLVWSAHLLTITIAA